MNQSLSGEHKGVHCGRKHTSLQGQTLILQQLLVKCSLALLSVQQPLAHIFTWQHTVRQSHVLPFPAVECLSGSKARPVHMGMQKSMCACCPTPRPQLSPFLLLNSPSSSITLVSSPGVGHKHGLKQGYSEGIIHSRLPTTSVLFFIPLATNAIRRKTKSETQLPPPF